MALHARLVCVFLVSFWLLAQTALLVGGVSHWYLNERLGLIQRVTDVLPPHVYGNFHSRRIREDGTTTDDEEFEAAYPRKDHGYQKETGCAANTRKRAVRTGHHVTPQHSVLPPSAAGGANAAPCQVCQQEARAGVGGGSGGGGGVDGDGSYLDWEGVNMMWALENPEVWNDLGLAYRAIGQLDRSLETLERSRAILLHPDGCVNVGTTHFLMGNLNDAEFAFREGLDLDPLHPLLHFCLGALLQATGNTDDAIRHYEEALAFQPGFKAAQIHLQGLRRPEKGWGLSGLSWILLGIFGGVCVAAQRAVQWFATQPAAKSTLYPPPQPRPSPNSRAQPRPSPPAPNSPPGGRRKKRSMQ